MGKCFTNEYTGFRPVKKKKKLISFGVGTYDENQFLSI